MLNFKQRWRLLVGVVGTAVFLTVGFVLAGGVTMPLSMIGSAGGVVTQDGITLQTVIGQPTIGTVDNDEVLCSGILCSPDAPPISGGTSQLYLPYVSR